MASLITPQDYVEINTICTVNEYVVIDKYKDSTQYVNNNKGGVVSQPFTVRAGGDLGRAINEARRARGLTQTQFAEQMGFDQAYLARLEGGHSVQLLDRAVRALRALGADVWIAIPDPEQD